MFSGDPSCAIMAIHSKEAGSAYHDASPPHPPGVKTSSATVPPGPDIPLLTRAARRGDAAAFSNLYDLFAFRLYKYLLVLAHGNESEAREVCQAAFIKLAKRCDVFENEDKFWAWLCVLGRNAFIDHCRARQRRNRFISLDELIPEPGSPAPEQRLEDALREILATLPAGERELLQAAYVDNYPIRRLAEESGQTYKAVESKLGRLRQKVKEKLLKDLNHETRA